MQLSFMGINGFKFEGFVEIEDTFFELFIFEESYTSFIENYSI